MNVTEHLKSLTYDLPQPVAKVVLDVLDQIELHASRRIGADAKAWRDKINGVCFSENNVTVVTCINGDTSGEHAWLIREINAVLARLHSQDLIAETAISTTVSYDEATGEYTVTFSRPAPQPEEKEPARPAPAVVAKNPDLKERQEKAFTATFIGILLDEPGRVYTASKIVELIKKHERPRSATYPSIRRCHEFLKERIEGDGPPFPGHPICCQLHNDELEWWCVKKTDWDAVFGPHFEFLAGRDS